MEMENCREIISAVADGLLHYKLNLGMWLNSCVVSRALKRLFTPALNILLKCFEMEIVVRLITQVNYFSNIYKILTILIIDKSQKYFDLKIKKN
jgi:hypothetical protein